MKQKRNILNKSRVTVGREWDGRGEREEKKINEKKQNNNVHVANLSGEIDIAHRRRLSLKKVSP